VWKRNADNIPGDIVASFPVEGSNACRTLQSERETHYNVLGKTCKRYLVAEEFGELLQLRETLGKVMVVLMVDGELEVGSVARGRDLIAVNGGENLTERLGLVGVKTQPEGTGCLYLSYQLVAGQGVKKPLYLPCCLSSWFFFWDKGRTKGTIPTR